jgi:hypothetical protein
MKNRITSFFPSLTFSSPLFRLPLSSLLLTFLTFFAASVATAQVPSYVPTNGLVGYWPFNGNANDESGNGNNGTVNGATSATDRFNQNNKAFHFDGTTSHISVNLNSIGNGFPANAEITSNVWVKTSDNDGPLISFQGDGGFEYDFHIGTLADIVQNPGHYGMFLRDNCCGTGNNIFGSAVNNDSWQMMTIVRSSNGTLSLYLNGVFELSGNAGASGALTFNTQYMSFGSDQSWVIATGLGCNSCNSVDQQHLNGSLDDIGIWNRALTADEVLALYNGCNVTPIAIAGSNTPGAFATSTYTCDNTVGSTYNWTVSNGVIASGQGTNSVSILWGAEGIGSVSVEETTADGCVGDAVIYDVNVQCVVSGNAIEGPVGPEAFSNSTYTCNGATNSTYQWTITNGVIVSGQGTNTVNILWASTGIGNISVVETTFEGCAGTTLSQDVVVVPVSVEEFTTAISLFPNPATNEINLQTTTDLIGSDLIIFDALGKQIHMQQILSTNTRINTTAFAAGNYVVKVGGVVKRFEVKH